MDLSSYYDLISSEGNARKYLLGKCFKNHQRFCPRCRLDIIDIDRYKRMAGVIWIGNRNINLEMVTE